MPLEQSNFRVDVWNAEGIYNRISDLSDPNMYLTADFSAGYLEVPPGKPDTNNLFSGMIFSIHTAQNNPEKYYARLRAIYQKPEDSAWNNDQIELLQDHIKSMRTDYKPILMYIEPRPFIYTGIDLPEESQRFRIGVSRLIEGGERAFEMFIAGEPIGLLSLDQHVGKFLRRVYRWGKVIEDVINAAVEVKHSTQQGVLKIGTIHFRAFISSQIEPSYGD